MLMIRRRPLHSGWLAMRARIGDFRPSEEKVAIPLKAHKEPKHTMLDRPIVRSGQDVRNSESRS